MDIYCRQKFDNNSLYDPLHNMISDLFYSPTDMIT